MRRIRNPVYGSTVPWVRIPPSPPKTNAPAGAFLFGGCGKCAEPTGFDHEALARGTPLAAGPKGWRDRHRARPTQTRPFDTSANAPDEGRCRLWDGGVSSGRELPFPNSVP